VKDSESIISKMFKALPELTSVHSRNTETYQLLNMLALAEVKSLFSEVNAGQGREFGPFGKLIFPYRTMGAINSLDLFGLDELIIFAFYWQNRHRYRSTLDIGANIGLHSILMARVGFKVRSFEPDPVTMKIHKENLALNDCRQNDAVQAAVSDKKGSAEFVRVLGNTTGSHLAGAKSSPYGDLEKFPVEIVPIQEQLEDVQFMKLDAEGHEVVILRAIDQSKWKHLDAMVEIGTPENAKLTYGHLSQLGVNMFAQKFGWKRVQNEQEMPTSYKEGSLFITAKDAMPWQ